MTHLGVLHRIFRYQCMLVVITGVCMHFVRPQGMWHAVLAACIMTLNTAALRFLIMRAMQPGASQKLYLALAAGKWLIVMALVTAVVFIVKPDGVAFAAGLATFFVAVGAGLLHQAMQPNLSRSSSI